MTGLSTQWQQTMLCCMCERLLLFTREVGGCLFSRAFQILQIVVYIRARTIRLFWVNITDVFPFFAAENRYFCVPQITVKKQCNAY